MLKFELNIADRKTLANRMEELRDLTSTGYRIRFREQLYNIESVDPMNYQKKILKIHCRLERRQPDEQNRQHR